MGVVEMKRLLLMVLVSSFLVACGSEEAAEVEEEESNVVVYDDELKYDGFMVEGVETEVVDDTLHLTFRWINRTGEKMHFTYLGFVDVTQGESVLEESSGAYDMSNKSNILFSNADGGSHRVDLEYEIVSDEDIEVTFGSNQTDKRDTITVQLD